MALCNNAYRISLTEADLPRGYLFLRNIPPPTDVNYKDYSEIQSHGRGGASKYGFKNIEITWTNMSAGDARRLRKIVDAALAQDEVYITFDRNNGQGGLYDWVDAVGTPHPLEMQPLNGIAGTVGNGQASIVWKVNAIAIVLEPADV